RILNDLWGSMIEPGSQCPWSIQYGAWFGMKRAVFDSGGDAWRERWAEDIKRLKATDKLLVEIDGVLFSDGSFVGPDYNFEFDRIEAQNKGALDMIVELN